MPRTTVLFLVVVLLAAAPAIAQERDSTLPRLSPNAATSFQLGVTDIEVTYGAPSVRDRTIFGDLVPYDEVWRAGANEATTVTFSTDVIVEGQALEAGSYMLAAIPRTDRWTIILNDQPGQWGTYQYDDQRDVLRVDVTPRSAPVRETLAFTFDNVEDRGEAFAERHAVDLVLEWADVSVPLRIETETDRHVVARAAAALEADDVREPLAFARYAMQTGRHIDQAITWAAAAIALEENYFTLAVAARLHAARGDYGTATELGERALALADAMDRSPGDVDAFRAEVAEWRGDQ